MSKKKWLMPVITVVAFGLIVLPLQGKNSVDLPLQANLTNIGLLVERVALHEGSEFKKNNATSALIRVTARGLYEMKAQGKLEANYVEENREELFSKLVNFQTGVSGPDKFVERISNFYSEIDEKVNVPIVTVTEETALGRAIKDLPHLLDKTTEELTKDDISLLIDQISGAYEIRKAKIEVSEVKFVASEKSGEGEDDEEESGLFKLDPKTQTGGDQTR